MIHIAITEDDDRFAGKLQDYINQYMKDNHLEIVTKRFRDGSELIFEYKPVYDILLLDIEMPKVNGMDAARAVRKMDGRVIIIFITNMAQYAINGYEVGALDFVLKPVKYFPFSVKLTKAIHSIQQLQRTYLMVPYESELKKVYSDDIIFIEIRDHWLHIFTADMEYKMLGSLKEMISKLKEYHFVICNSCFLINMKYITCLKKDSVILNEKYELKVSRSRKKELKQEIMGYYEGGMR